MSELGAINATQNQEHSRPSLQYLEYIYVNITVEFAQQINKYLISTLLLSCYSYHLTS